MTPAARARAKRAPAKPASATAEDYLWQRADSVQRAIEEFAKRGIAAQRAIDALGAGKPAVRRKNSRAFTPHPNTKRRTIMIDRIPATLHEAIGRKAKREGVSLRALLLSYLTEWSTP